MPALPLGLRLAGAVGLGVLIVGSLTMLRLAEPNRCAMSYMHPAFKEVPIPPSASPSGAGDSGGRYRLLRYYDRQVTPQAGSFGGLTMFFVPGHGGDFKQVRSLGSAGALGALSRGIGWDCYTFDFAEDWSGLSGSVLELQLEFAVHAATYVIKDSPWLTSGSYNGGPRSIMVVGHSFGGLVARRLAANPDISESVAVVLTLATPHAFPPIVTDPVMAKLYQYPRTEAGDDGKASFNGSHKNSDDRITLISVGGGSADWTVPAAAIALDTVNRTVFDAHVIETTAMLGVGMAVDHLCILWCRQLVTALIGAVFNMVDPTTGHFMASTAARRRHIRALTMPRPVGPSNLEATSILDDSRDAMVLYAPRLPAYVTACAVVVGVASNIRSPLPALIFVVLAAGIPILGTVDWRTRLCKQWHHCEQWLPPPLRLVSDPLWCDYPLQPEVDFSIHAALACMSASVFTGLVYIFSWVRRVARWGVPTWAWAILVSGAAVIFSGYMRSSMQRVDVGISIRIVLVVIFVWTLCTGSCDPPLFYWTAVVTAGIAMAPTLATPAEIADTYAEFLMACAAALIVMCATRLPQTYMDTTSRSSKTVLTVAMFVVASPAILQLPVGTTQLYSIWALYVLAAAQISALLCTKLK